jgi:hypothetical protein
MIYDLHHLSCVKGRGDDTRIFCMMDEVAMHVSRWHIRITHITVYDIRGFL